MALKKILAPTDLSLASLEGLKCALERAASAGAEVIVYHVIGSYEVAPYYALEESYVQDEFPSFTELIDERRKQVVAFLQRYLASLAAGVTVRIEVAVGVPYQQIIDRAAKEHVDMIILSTHGRTGLLHVVIGSVAEKIVRLASCPVLTVRPERRADQRAAA
jgi:universal stress protein A